MKCKICNSNILKVFEAQILKKYLVSYYVCSECGFMQTEDPYWLDEAYSDSIAIGDTGILQRNLYALDITSILIYFIFDKNAKFIDFAGGYGILTRLMRDNGFDFYWNDPYSKNILARGFEYDSNDKVEMATAFEVFEHFTDPLKEINKMLTFSDNILFTTVLLPTPIPKPGEWSYYVLDHGQHISFYTLSSLNILANKYGLNFLTNGSNVHLFTRKKVSSNYFRLLLKLRRTGLARYICSKMNSLTVGDMDLLSRRSVPK